MFDVQRIAGSGLVRHVDYHETLGSTNDRALELAAHDHLPLPLLVLADQQTSGRGRGTNRWQSSQGALTFSLVLDLAGGEIPQEERSRVALIAGLAVCEALAEMAPHAEWRVKWPNDVLADGRKMCGILCESVPGHGERLVVGIGININNSLKDSSLSELATSMIDLDGLSRDRTEALLSVIDRFDMRWGDVVARRFPMLAAEYRKRCFLSGKAVTITSGGQRFVGLCRGIDDRGSLVLATECGLRTMVAGSIESWQ